MNDAATGASELELLFMQIISFSGIARTKYIEAMRASRKADKEAAMSLIKEGKEAFNSAHDVHLKLFGDAEASSGQYTMLLIHVEDQLMSAETFGILAEEFLS